MKPLSPRVIDLKGERFGRLVVIALDSVNRIEFWTCLCDCGVIKTVRAGDLRDGAIRSCGCLRSEVSRSRARTHGQSKSAEYRIWKEMWRRCTNPKRQHYAAYGGRGITVSPEWRDFTRFMSDMGPRPSRHHSLNRIDNDGPYVPGNVCWETAKAQAANRRVRRDLGALAMFASHKGERNGRAKLNQIAIIVIRWMLANGVARARIATAYKVSLSTIKQIKSRKLWSNVA